MFTIQNEKASMKKKNNCLRPRCDRFIAPRSALPEMKRRLSWPLNQETELLDIWYSKHIQKKKFMNHVDEAFGLDPIKCSDLKTAAKPDEFYIQPWPCVPRKKGYLSSADSILDLPTYSHKTFPELLDWSNDNILVAALGRNYHRWSWRTQSLVNQGFTHYNIECCKFDPRGERLLLGTDRKNVEVHSNVLNKWIGGHLCKCYNLAEFCAITAVDWSPTGNSFVTGCSRGVVMTFSRDSTFINCGQITRDPIFLVRVSPNARYLAVAALNTKKVIILVWPTLEQYSTLNAQWTIKTMAWHPWRSAFLGVGTDSENHQPSIALLDVASSRLQVTPVGHSHYVLDVMLFSHRTGELVFSLWNTESSSIYPKSQLVVMSDPETVVDQWGEGRSGLDRVRTMVFSPDGTKLATATLDEDLIIWNFLPEDKKPWTRSKRFSALSVYLDETTHGYSLR